MLRLQGMSAQPPHRPRTAEIDIREVLAGPESDRAPADSSTHWVERGSRALPGKNLLRGYNTAAGIGWSGWTNIVFAALTSIGVLFWALRGFDSHERFRSIHGRVGEYVYPRPAPGDQAARRFAATGSGLAPTGRSEWSATATTFNSSSVPHPFTDRTDNPSLPADPNSGSLNGNHPETTASSARTNEAGSGRSSAEGKSASSHQVGSKTRTRSSSRVEKNVHHSSSGVSSHFFSWIGSKFRGSAGQRGKLKSGTSSTGSQHAGAPISRTGPAKSNQSSIGHSLNGASRLSGGTIRGAGLGAGRSGLGGGLGGLGGGRGGR